MKVEKERKMQVGYFGRDEQEKNQEMSTKEEANESRTEGNTITKDEKERNIQVFEKAIEIKGAGDKFSKDGLERNFLVERPRPPKIKLTGSGVKIEIPRRNNLHLTREKILW